MAALATLFAAACALHRIAASAYPAGTVVVLEDGRLGIYQGLKAAISGDLVAVSVEGLYKMPCATGTTFSLGDPLFWNTSTKLIVPYGNTLQGDDYVYAGQAEAAKTSGQLTATVNLNLGWRLLRPFPYEFVTASDSTLRTLIPAYMNPTGLRIQSVTGKVTEVYAGASEDQGVVTVKYGSTTIGVLTPTNAGADAVGDVIQATAAANAILSATGVATVDVPAGQAVKAIVSQATSGAGAAGKTIVYILAQPLA